MHSSIVSPRRLAVLAMLMAGTASAQDPVSGLQVPSAGPSPLANPAADPFTDQTPFARTGGNPIVHSVGTNALDFDPNSGSCAFNQNQTVGWMFDVTDPVTVCAMSWYDENGDGLDVAHEVGIWTPNGTLIAATNVTIPAGTAATLDGIWRTVAIPPVTLIPGQGYVVGGYNGTHGECVSSNATQTPHPDLTYVDAMFSGLGGTLARPDQASVANTGFYGVGFQIDPNGGFDKHNAMAFVEGSGVCASNLNQTIGWSFDVVESVTVSSMSWFDEGQNGLDVAHEVGIWTPGGVLIPATNVTIPAGAAADLNGKWRTVSIAPVTLPPGQGYVVGGFNGVHGECVSAGVIQQVHPNLAYVDARFSNLGTTLEEPISTSVAINGFYGVSFRVLEDGGPIPYCVGNPNSVDPTGALLSSAGAYGTAAATFDLTQVPNQPGLLFSGPNGIDLPFGCGRRCIGGFLIRGSVFVPSGNQALGVPFDMSAPTSLRMQYWYRDPANFGSCGNTYNLSNALQP